MAKQQHTDIELTGGAKVTGQEFMAQVVSEAAPPTNPTGVKGDLGPFAFPCEIMAWDLLGDQSGSIQIDVWKDSYANYPPTDADSITASAPIAASAAAKAQDSTLTGWTKSISAGQSLRFNVDSVTSFQRVQIMLKLKRT